MSAGGTFSYAIGVVQEDYRHRLFSNTIPDAVKKKFAAVPVLVFTLKQALELEEY